jgi:hypothetical protein
MPANSEFIQVVCPKCGEPKNALRNGVEVSTRCTCDWERGYHERIRRTVMPTFYENGRKTIKDWSPPIFKQGGCGDFKAFIRVQKSLVMKKVYDFCFRVVSSPDSPKVYSLNRSIETNHNLYIRGPLNSGRDLLLASVKIFAAAKDISATPVPYEWATFKQDVAQSDWQGREAETARIRLADLYRTVKLLTLANVQSETSWSDDKKPRRFRSSLVIDDILTRRMTMSGSMVLTSHEFIGQIADSLGDRLPEVLTSPKTTIIIMLSVDEADSLLTSLTRKIHSLRTAASKTRNVMTQKKIQEDVAEKKILEDVLDCLYLETLTPQLPETSPDDTLLNLLEINPGSHPQKVNEMFAQFKADQQANNLTYREGLKKAKIMAVTECQELKHKLSVREMEEVGDMLSLACAGKERIDTLVQEAMLLREKMVSE